MSERWFHFQKASTITLAREALMERIIKLALDGKQDLKREAEGALADINAELVASLPDRMSTPDNPLIRCFIHKSELRDLEAALTFYLNTAREVNSVRLRFNDLLRNTQLSLSRVE
jgi:hypothetical protein